MWVDIKGWEGLYEVNESGDVRNKANRRLIIGDTNSTGYMRVCLYRKGHVPRKQRFFRHRLVATHFIPNPNGLPEVNHIDSNVRNNVVCNLEWVSKAENERHSHTVGHKLYRGYTVEYLDGGREHFVSNSELAQRLGLTNRSVTNWLQGKNSGFKKYKISKIYYSDSVKKSNDYRKQSA